MILPLSPLVRAWLAAVSAASGCTGAPLGGSACAGARGPLSARSAAAAARPADREETWKARKAGALKDIRDPPEDSHDKLQKWKRNRSPAGHGPPRFRPPADRIYPPGIRVLPVRNLRVTVTSFPLANGRPRR